eukprot:gene1128-biopygen19756
MGKLQEGKCKGNTARGKRQGVIGKGRTATETRQALRAVRHVRRVEQQKRIGGVVLLNDANQLALVEELRVPRAVHVRGAAIEVVLVREVVQTRVVPTAVRRVRGSGHPRIPLTGKVRLVSCRFQLGREPGHIAGDASVIATRVAQSRVHVHREPPRLHRSPRRGAHTVDVVPREVDAAGDQPIEVGRRYLAVRLLAVEPDIGVAQIVHKDEEHVWRSAAHSGGAGRESRQGGNGRHVCTVGRGRQGKRAVDQ